LNQAEATGELRYAIAKLSAYRLHQSAKWAGELLLSIVENAQPPPSF
jgi:hypothetical protein